MNYPAPTKHDIQALLQGYTVETTPKSAKAIGDFSRWLEPGTGVYVTFLPGTAIEKTIETAAELKQQGMRPVPHIALRGFGSDAQLHRVLAQLRDIGIDDILLIAGSLHQPKGPYYSVQNVLEQRLLEDYGFSGFGFAGHPEGNPDIPSADLRDAEAIKQRYATVHPRRYWFVTQFCFDVVPVIAWQQQLHKRNIQLPLRIGVAGLATVATLLKHARACGIGPSISYLFKKNNGIRQLMNTSAPDDFMTKLAAFRAAEPQNTLAGLHFYPLGGFERTMEWVQAVKAGRFEWRKEGFHVY